MVDTQTAIHVKPGGLKLCLRQTVYLNVKIKAESNRPDYWNSGCYNCLITWNFEINLSCQIGSDSKLVSYVKFSVLKLMPEVYSHRCPRGFMLDVHVFAYLKRNLLGSCFSHVKIYDRSSIYILKPSILCISATYLDNVRRNVNEIKDIQSVTNVFQLVHFVNYFTYVTKSHTYFHWK